jgi:hypothetical protein
MKTTLFTPLVRRVPPAMTAFRLSVFYPELTLNETQNDFAIDNR